MTETSHNWRVAVLSFFTFGLSVGVPYYALPFFYDYLQQPQANGGIGITRPELMLGFPIATLLTLWIGPAFLRKLDPRASLMTGATLLAISFLLFANLATPGWLYYGAWLVFMTGYIFAGPIPHQVLIANWFTRERGRAMALVYVGVGLFGALSAKAIAAPLTRAFGFRGALLGIAALVLLIWPLAVLLPKGVAATREPAATQEPLLFRTAAFWALLASSFCSIGAIGSVNQHLKLILAEQGFRSNQQLLDETYANVLAVILVTSIAGRILFGWLADRYPVKWLLVGVFAGVGASIPLLMLASPDFSPYPFACLFGLAMGADYMLIPLLAASHFGPQAVGVAMSLILPADLIALAWCPYGISLFVQPGSNGYASALQAVLAIALAGAVVAAAGIPRPRK